MDTLYQDIIKKVDAYLEENHARGKIIDRVYEKAKQTVPENLDKWLNDPKVSEFAPHFKEGLRNAAAHERWDHIIEAFYTDIAFGTGGIRGVAAFTQEEFNLFKEQGIDAPILMGPNTINKIVLLLKTAGVAKWAADKNLQSAVIGFDSRMNGKAFAELVAKTFLHAGLKVYLFDEACPYPELCFAIPTVGADFGILISASHNDKRYNGYKLSSKTGAQFDAIARNEIFENYIVNASLDTVNLQEFKDAKKGKLVFLGGGEKLPDMEYCACELIDMHSKHIAHVKKFLMHDDSWLKDNAKKINIGYNAYYGAGYKAVPRLLKELHFNAPIESKEMNVLDGSFPKFDLAQQPDPGDQIGAEIAINALKQEMSSAESSDGFEDLDIILGTDPDADRVGLSIKIPKADEEYVKLLSDSPIKSKIDIPQRDDFSWMLLDADIAWPILLWFRLMMDQQRRATDNSKKFIVSTHTTSDLINAVAKKFGIGVIETWVGFAFISNSVLKTWNHENISPENNPTMIHRIIDMQGREINIGGFEQSNGYSIFGSKPEQNEVFHKDGHVRDKDGTFAAIMVSELAAWAKEQGTTIYDLIDEKLYLDPDIGLYVTYYEPAPFWGQFEGLTGFSEKINIVEKVKKMYQNYKDSGSLEIRGMPVLSADYYSTGKYDELHGYPKGSKEFPEEGIRFYFDEAKENHVTMRPSGTSQALRYHVQLKAKDVSKDNLLEKKIETNKFARAIVKDLRGRVEN